MADVLLANITVCGAHLIVSGVNVQTIAKALVIELVIVMSAAICESILLHSSYPYICVSSTKSAFFTRCKN